MSEIVTYLPEIASASAFAAGVVIDRAAAIKGDSKRAEALSTQGMTQEEFDAAQQGRTSHQAPVLVERQTAMSRISERAKHLAIPTSMAVAAGLAVTAWSHEETPVKSNVVIGAVADHSYQTSLNGSDKLVNSIFDELAHTGKIKVRASVAHNGGYDFTKPEDVKNDTKAYGPSSVRQAVTASLSDTLTTKAAAVNTAYNKTGTGLFIATNDNSIGSAKSLEKQEVPIFIANVGEGNDDTAKDLRAIAKKTGGKYWDKSAKPTEIVDYMEHKLKPHVEAAPSPADNKLFEKVLAFAAAALAAGLIASRSEARFKGKRRESK